MTVGSTTEASAGPRTRPDVTVLDTGTGEGDEPGVPPRTLMPSAEASGCEPVRVAADRWLVNVMDTVFSLVIPQPTRGDGSRGALSSRHDDGSREPSPWSTVVEAIADDWRTTEERLSVFRPDSEINLWQRGEILDDRLSPETRAVIAACDRLERRTGGLFSAHRDGGYDPSGHARTYDPTGYVKGWALARAARLLDQASAASYCVNGGGDVVARGLGPHHVPWRIGVAHPYRPGELATIVTTVPGDERTVAVATSGTGERGQHVIDPIDGWRPTCSTVTVVGHDIALADAIATAALAAGHDGSAAPAALVVRFGLEAFGFGEDRRPWWTPGMTAYAPLPTSPCGQGQ